MVIAARSEEQLAEVEKECGGWGGQVVRVVADVSQHQDCRAIVEKARSEFGGLDILILNAALSPTPQLFQQYEEPVSCGSFCPWNLIGLLFAYPPRCEFQAVQ